MTRTARTAVPLHPLLAERWSPRAFDPTPLSDEDVAALLEAARWAPSAMNHQPWRFLVGRQDHDGTDATYKGIYDALAGGNQQWASSSPLLVAALVRTTEEDGSPRAIAPYELGLAVSQLTVQAHALGLHVHQMAGFDAEQLRATFGVPASYTPVVVLSVGRQGNVESLPAWAAERETAPRERLDLAEIAYADEFGLPLAV
jgi:nitroreductase